MSTPSAVQCPRCGSENAARARFCGDCGGRLEQACPQCQAPNPAGKKFCLDCGSPLETSTRTASPSQPQAYTPAHLAERILASKAALEGERKQVTVLFADLKGSMELLTERDPEEARAILDPVLHLMMEAVHRYEGTVNQVMGDGIMALFGAPIAHEDHALRACYAALAMQEGIRRHNHELQERHGMHLQIRVGVNSGEVVVRSIGSDLRMDYTAVGQTTHLAARMEQLASPGAVLLAPETLRLVEGLVQVQTLGRFAVKGLTEPLEVFELRAAAPTRRRLNAAAARGLTRFVGRETELEVLRRTLERAGAGQGQVVAVVGEPGVGKSRLAWEFTRSHRTQGWLVREASSVSYGRASSYLPLIELLKSYCGIEPLDDSRRVREKLTGKLLTLDEALRPALTPLLFLLDAPVNDPAWQALEPAQRRQGTLEAVKRVFLREAREQPLLLVFEDLHWIDAETQALLDSLVESLPTARILLLVNYRPEYSHSWGSKTYYSQMRLDPLPQESAQELLEALLGSESSLATLKRLLIQRTEGNPFFLEESVRALVESGALTGERGAYRLARAVDQTQVPATVQAVLAARIDRLSPEDKRLLQAAAVVGKDVPFSLLQTVAEQDETELRKAMARLQAAEFLYEASLFPELEYTFKHALTHEVAYNSLVQERRRTLHARIAQALEDLHAGHLSEQVERLAHHAFRGERWTNAAEYLRQAGAKAASRSAYAEAVNYFEQALLALGRLPRERETLAQIVDVRLELRHPHRSLGQLEASLADMEEAEALARALGDDQRLGRVLSLQTANYWIVGRYEHALETARQALALGEAGGDIGIQIVSHYALGRAYHAMGQYRAATECLERSLAAIGEDLVDVSFGQPFLPAVASRAWLTWCLAEQGHFAEGIRLGREAVEIAEREGRPFSRVTASVALSGVCLAQGNVREAIASLGHSYEVCQAAELALLLPSVRAYLGYAYALDERPAEALPLLEQAVAGAEAMGHLPFLVQALLWRGEAHLLAGRTEQAAADAERNLSLTRAHGKRGDEAWTLRLLGEIAAHADPPDVEQAEAHDRQALVLAEELKMRPLVAHCHLGLGRLYRQIDQVGRAESELTSALKLYRTMDLSFWLEQAEREATALASAGSGAR